MSPKKLAELTSIILGPFVWPVVLIIVVFSKAGLTVSQLQVLLPAIFLIEVVVPIGYLLIGPKLGWTGSWDAKSLKERGDFLFVVLAATLASLGFVYFFGNKLLLNIGLVMMIYLAVFWFVNHFWRISFHTGLNVAATILVNFLFDWKLPWLYLLIPVVFWARLELKKHTVNQLLAGIAVSGVLAMGGLYVFGYV